MSIIDINGLLTFYDLDARPEGLSGGKVGKHLTDFERKDVWDMKWADDNPELFAVMEKTRMYIFRGTDPEEPVNSSAYLCNFSDLQIRAVSLDEVMRNPEQPEIDQVVNFETKSLRDTRHILESVSVADAYSFVKDHPHPRLWRILAEHALENLDYAVADKAFVRCQDYYGIQFVKRLQILDEKAKQKAEVCIYFKRFDEAETLYAEIDRNDLAIELRMRMGDWFKVEKLIQAGGGDDSMLATCWNRIGDYYADRQKWAKAAQYYAQAKHTERLLECLYVLENWQGLEQLIHTLPEGSPLLCSIADNFQSVGLSEHAVTGYLKGGDVKAAIDCCVQLNQWDQAVQLAEAHNFNQIETLLTKYATHLLEKGKTLQAIELYRKANRHSDAARLLSNLAQEAAASRVNLLRVKKLYILAALEVERFRKKTLEAQMSGTTPYGSVNRSAAAATLEGLMQHEAATALDRSLENAWHGAEAFHLWLLAHRQLYNGHVDAAMKTALRLRDYEGVIDVTDIYSLMALTAFYNKHYGQCSKAFIKLESLPELPRKKREALADLAMAIFTRFPPNDPSSRKSACPICRAPVQDWQNKCSTAACDAAFPMCVASGRAIVDDERVKCATCKHFMIASELHTVDSCPLCHAPLEAKHRRNGGSSYYGNTR